MNLQKRCYTTEKTKEWLASGKQNIEIASLACGTMYDVLGAHYENRKNLSFCGLDVDRDSLLLAQEKANSLSYDKDQIKLCECDVISSSLPEDQYDVIVCNGFSFYIKDESLCQVIENVKNALKTNGIFLMSFTQPPTTWQTSEEEKEADIIVKKIYDAFPMNWSANLRSSDQVVSLVKKSGLNDVSVLEESHQIHPLILAYKR